MRSPLKRSFRPAQLRRKVNHPRLVQEEAGIHVGISPILDDAARHAASVMARKYRHWLNRDRHSAWGRYKQLYFTVAVGGGNTLKAQYNALVKHHHADIDWLAHVRFFFLEESSGEAKWESAENSLVMNFIVPLAQKLVAERGMRATAKKLDLPRSADTNDIIDRMIVKMLNPIDLTGARQALANKNPSQALKLANSERDRYQLDIQKKLGPTMSFHYIISGIGKKGTLGAFTPYTPELSVKEPGVIVLKQGKSALRVALNRGVLINAERISLIVSGSLKLRALGRFEMEESADFEQTVLETPLRMLRETPEIAEKVYIFADEQALHFDETVFEYTENNATIANKAETRDGEESNGIHILLMHGFMGLFSFASFLVRLPSAWTVSALHRGSIAKTLDDEAVFPHYARFLRKAMLKNWRQGRPVPVAGHSIAGVISDHLLLSIIGDYDDPVPAYESLKGENKQLVDAMRASGIIHLATWAPSDIVHMEKNVKSVISHHRHDTRLDYSGVEKTYKNTIQSGLKPTGEAAVDRGKSLVPLNIFLKLPTTEPVINSLNLLIRHLLNNKTVQQRLLNTNSPYVMRLVGKRLLKTASFYGLCKEINAALHDPAEYQRRHLKALDIMLEYDIPFLSIIHEDDFLVSARRHREEHQYLLAQRKRKEGVGREQDLRIPVRFILLRREQAELPPDPLNPHLMIMSTNPEGNKMARDVTAAITDFVNENVARAAGRGDVAALASVKSWARQNRRTGKRSKPKK